MCNKSIPLQAAALLLLCLFFTRYATAGVTADFKADKTGGCSPLTISFTNTSQGVSAAATYKWDFGNGNTSVLKDAGSTYTEAKTYTVILTVTDGSQSGTKTMQVTVYHKPQPDFTFQPAKGCQPLQVNFTSTATPGDGTLAGYVWDFGDGATYQGTTATMNHTYDFAQNASVSLTVTNSFGCYNTIQKNNIIQVQPSAKAGFTADKTVVCKVSDAVQFTNTSTGNGNLSYVWDFGDQTTSAEPSPAHVYAAAGTYQVALQVTSAEGCTGTYRLPNAITVGSLTADFDVPTLLCTGTTIMFTGKSTPPGASLQWQFSNNSFAYQGSAVAQSFWQPGTYTATLTAVLGTCTQPVTKTFTVNGPPNLKGFVSGNTGLCGAPATLTFQDTTSTAVKWLWSFNSVTATTKETTHTFTENGTNQVSLTVTNAQGCAASVTQYIPVIPPNVRLDYAASTSPAGLTGCPGFTVQFMASSNDPVTSYRWDLGEGDLSTAASPQHQYNHQGTFTIKLNYLTSNGCSGAVATTVRVYPSPNVDFSVLEPNPICGNTPVHLIGKADGPVDQWSWDFGNGVTVQSYEQNPVVQYNQQGNYTVRLIAANGSCKDTVIKENFLFVVPPFPKIDKVINLCAGNRGTVNFAESSRQVNTWNWDFGDGGTASYSAARPLVEHTYARTGRYKVVLTAVNGQCAVRDSAIAYVLLKQQPLLAAGKTQLCSSDQLGVQVTAFEPNPRQDDYYYYGYYATRWEYRDGSVFNGVATGSSYWQNVYEGTLSGFQRNRKDIRIITTSAFFGCADTSNFIPLTIRGPLAALTIPENNVCFKNDMVFADASQPGDEVPIRQWIWNYGDGRADTATQPVNRRHRYTSPGSYPVSLTVVDANGCRHTSSAGNAQANGPQAGFSWNPFSVKPGQTISFNNETNQYGNYSALYDWRFTYDRSALSSYNTYKNYPFAGIDTVTLIVRNTLGTCIDTVVKHVPIKNIVAAFTFSSTYLNGNSCPPALVRMINQSSNAARVRWDFGDGAQADNVHQPTHTYTQPGKYPITLYAYDNEGTVDMAVDTVEIKGPYGSFIIDVLQSCGPRQVNFTATAATATAFTWDFADGTLLQGTSTTAQHLYALPGVYRPSIILKDNSGCAATFAAKEPVVIDSLVVDFSAHPSPVCDSGWVRFLPLVKDIAADQLQRPLQYTWSAGTVGAGTTSQEASPAFFYNQTGEYTVQLKVVSSAGCEQSATRTIQVLPKTKGSLYGPDTVCQRQLVQFTAAASGLVDQWNWVFENGETAASVIPPIQVFDQPGIYPVRLVVSKGGCNDTLYHPLRVMGLPVTALLPQKPVLCLGDSLRLMAHDGVQYQWYPSTDISNPVIAAPLVYPVASTWYKVRVTGAFGCVSKDSVWVKVSRPFKVTLRSDTVVCAGNDLRLQAGGAVRYSWISGSALSSVTDASPVARPLVSDTYTVVGYGEDACFTDTVTRHVTVHAQPRVDAGRDTVVMVGTSVPFQAKGSEEVIRYSWSPAWYLSCINCPDPISTPRTNVRYEVTATSQYGCVAKDTLSVTLQCRQSVVFIPNSFTPGKDGINDVFYPRGKGIRLIRYLRVFNRLGEMVFERVNFPVEDRSQGWDGTYLGKQLNTDVFVYTSELICDTGETFHLNGTVMIIR